MNIDRLTVKTCPHCHKKISEVVNIAGDRVPVQPADYARKERARIRAENLAIKWGFIVFVIFGIAAISAAIFI